MPIDFRAYARQHPRFGSYVRTVETRPSWVAKAALAAAAIVILVPLVVLIVAGLLVGLAVFFVLGFVARVLDLFTGLPSSRNTNDPVGPDPTGPRDPSRENVRIIRE